MTRFIKVKAHSDEPLNEADDTLAGAAAEMDPTRPVDVDPEGVYFYYRETLVAWSARLRQHLTGGRFSVDSQECLAGPPTRRVLGRAEHSPYHSMAAPTSPELEDAGRRPVTNEDHPRKETSAPDYCEHVSWQRAQV